MANGDCPQRCAAPLFGDRHDDARSSGIPRGGKQSLKLRSAATYIAGTLVGIAVVMPVLMFDLAEGHGALVMAGSLILASAGIAMFVAGANARADPPANRSPE